MAMIGVGGDTSVQWLVRADNVRQTLVQSRGRSHRHEGIDETDKNAQFTIIISAPRDKEARARFFGALRQAVARESDLRVTIPIEDKQSGRRNPQQVQILWDSSEKPNLRARLKRFFALGS